MRRRASWTTLWAAVLMPWPAFLQKSPASLKDGAILSVVIAADCARVTQEKPIRLTVAKSEAFQHKGLGQRRSALKEGEGMLFLFHPPRIGQIWMKDTFIPLQLVHVLPQGQIVFLQEMPVEKDPAAPTKIYSAPHLVNAVLELKPGRLSAGDVGKFLCVRSGH